MFGHADSLSATVHRNIHAGCAPLAIIASAGRRAITWSVGTNFAWQRISISHAKRRVAKHFDCESLGKRGWTTPQPGVSARNHRTQYLQHIGNQRTAAGTHQCDFTNFRTTTLKNSPHKTFALAATFTIVCALQGCYSIQWPWSKGTSLTTAGLAPNPIKLPFEPKQCVYTVEPAQTTFFLSDFTPEELAAAGDLTGQVINIQLLWEPRPGYTPLDPTTTNVSIRLLVFSKGEVGMYGGGGFAWPRGTPGETDMQLRMTGSNLSLIAKTKGFVDLLSPGEMLGSVDATFNEQAAIVLRRTASQIISNKLGVVRWVDSAPLLDLNLASADQISPR